MSSCIFSARSNRGSYWNFTFSLCPKQRNQNDGVWANSLWLVIKKALSTRLVKMGETNSKKNLKEICVRLPCNLANKGLDD